ncbi:PKD domain-containing protein [Dehalococcoidia bacterium]|nr:PKD domain-containing protein [Dehalococcoidia bacterium]
MWSRTFGGAHLDWGFSVHQTDDGGFIVTGLTMFFGAGGGDLWLIKVAPEQPPIPIPPEPPSAIVVGHRVLPRDVAVGEEVTIGFTFTNTGKVAHTFGAGATLRSPDGRRIDFLKPVTVNPGEEGSAQWTHTIDVAGRWDVVFGVWEESTRPLENLVVETGWVDQYIIAIEAQERDYGLLWSFDTGKDVSSVSLSSDGAYIVAGSGREVILLNRKGKLLWSFQTAFPVTDVSISADASYIVVGTLRGGVIDDGWFYLLNREGELLGDFETTGISSVSISPCGSYWAITYQHGLGWWDRVTFFCRVEGSWLWVYTVGQSGTGAVSISADGKHIAVGSGAGAGDECEIRLYNKRGELLWRHEIPGRFLGREHSVSISADGRYIVAGDERGEEVLLLDYKGEIVWRYRTGIIEGVSISGDGSYVLAGSRNEIYLFSRDGEVLWNHPKDDLEDVSLSQDGSCIGVGSRSKVHLFVMDAPAIEPPSATIDSHTVSPRNITVGESVTIGFTFTNTGDKTHTFGAGATLRRDGDDATPIDFLEAVTVAPGETETVEWTHTIDTPGKWEVVFGVWQESTHPLESLVAQTGWVDEYITAVENQPPVAIIEPVTDRIVSGEPLLFDALNSYDPDGTIVSYRWDFGDGTTAEGSAVTHRFRGAQNEPKTYTIRLTVEDDLGATATETVQVTVDPIQQYVEFIAIPAPFDLPPLANTRMTVTYNWVDTVGERDIYIVSEIRGSLRLLAMSWIIIADNVLLWDMVPLIMWKDLLLPIPGWDEKYYNRANNFAVSFFGDKAVPITQRAFPEGLAQPVEVFEGIEVDCGDLMITVGVTLAKKPTVPWGARAFCPDEEELCPTAEKAIDETIGTLVDMLIGQLKSPGELRVYDSEGRVTGLVDGEIKQEIPHSVFDKENNTVTIFFPTDTYYFEVAGTEEATYGLTIMSVEEGEAEALAITDVPTTETTIHQFEIDREALVQAGVTMKTDADGDGVFEKQRTLQPPVASFAYSPEEMIAGQPITFDASGSSDPDGDIISHEWNFGDGTSGTGKVVEHTFALAGDYTVTLTIADNDGVVSSFSKKVTVAETAVDLPAPAVDPPDPAVDPPDPAVDPPVPAVDPPARLNWGIIGGIAVAVVVVGLGILFLVKRRRVAQQE